MMTALGIVLFVLGLLFSIWWHELGHFSTAKLFGMRVSQFMVGFGPTMFSRTRGETEYGIKWIPLGGYIRIIGMVPPARDGERRRTGRIAQLVEDIRGVSMQELRPGDETRAFYTKPWWQRAIVMLAGPVQNLILAFIIFAILLCGFGISQPSLTVATVSECVLPSTSTVTDCTTPVDDKGVACETGGVDCALPPKSPANAAGFRPGDEIVSVNGKPVADWAEVRSTIRVSADKPLDVEVVRGGDEKLLTVTPMKNIVVSDEDPDETVVAGFLGLSPTTEIVQQPLTAVPGQVGNFIVLSAEKLIGIPERIPQLFRAAFLGEERDPQGPIGVVGVSRISGEIFNLPDPPAQKIAFFLSLLASLNMVLFLFNLIPLYPLDGGHVAGALYEPIRNAFYRLRKKPSPGPIDIARLMPLAYVVASLVVVMSGMLLVADIVNPITLPQ